MKSPLERRQERIGETGRRAEKATGRRLGARMVRGSGNGWLKGDLFTDKIHVEAKSTINKSIGLKFDWLKKITQTAMERGKVPALTITFTTGDGEPKHNGNWILIQEGVLDELLRGKAGGE